MKTSELIGPALDWAVAKCEVGEPVGSFLDGVVAHPSYNNFRPSTNWLQGGPIIEREKIGIGHAWDRPVWLASEHNIEADVIEGPTPLIAAMRAYVWMKLGDEVDIPEELK